MLNPRHEAMRDHPFRRLAELIAGITPSSNEPPIMLSVGEPQGQPPALLAEALAHNAHLWNRYPQPQGTDELRQAAKGWLDRRYHLPSSMVDPDKHIIPVPGTREPLFMTALIAVPEQKNGKKPLILMPNPAYHIYTGAALASSGEAVYLPVSAETGFLPDLGAIDRSALERTSLMYLCSPANPQGAIASADYYKQAIGLARAHDFYLAVDECYAELYDRHPPPGVLEACRDLGGDLDRIIVFHSLSKRSSAPGLRSGFLAADPAFIQRYVLLFSYGGTPMPLPVQAASAALWNDESHVDDTRAAYRANFAVSEKVLGRHPGYFRPKAGMFLWLRVGDSPTVA
ncbi:MAG: aminotransferase class I/II-fold pyridoxal phosphate-dependent enzyme, partial [Alphaproteobacteria bacterium]|nr:aminotransferase class I/II-fold pyridoxal phosphate-dependent enzyme [Alphaproteobacteria bacterium]